MKLKTKLLIGAACIAVAAGAFLWEVYTPARRARAYMNEVAEVIPGKTTEAELRSKALFGNREPQCHDGECEYDLAAWNSALSTLHLAPSSTVGVIVQVQNGVVTEVWAGASLFSPSGGSTTNLREVAANAACGMKPCIRQMHSPQKMPQKFVHTTIFFDGSSDLRRHLAEAINPDCLHRLGGCTDPMEFAPVLKDASNFVQIKSWPPPADAAKRSSAADEH